MSLPASFARDFSIPERPFRNILIGIEGLTNTGKSELSLSAPGPIILIALDRNYQGMADNPNPPSTRDENHLIVPVPIALPGDFNSKEKYLPFWTTFYQTLRKALANPDVRTVVIDGDSDSVELQTMAEFGRTSSIMPRDRGPINQARRAIYSACFDSGKVVISTNKLKPKYVNQYNEQGVLLVDGQGEPKREWDGESYERQGFKDYEYIFEIQLRTLFRRRQRKDGTVVPEWGCQILMCKANRELEGEELWGSVCNIQSILELAYPRVPLDRWGY